MAFKSLLSVVTDVTVSVEAVRHAAGLAESYGAHLDVMCLGVDRTQTGYYYAGVNAVVLQETLAQARKESEELATAVRGVLESAQIRWGVEDGVCQLSDIARHVAARARFNDLVVLPHPYGEGIGIELEPIVEGALFEGQAPVLVLPDKGAVSAFPKRVVIGWNESAEALRAVRAALPILVKAENVHIVVVDPPRHSPARSDPGGQLSQYLSRHGVRAEIDVLAKTLPRVSDVLRRHVQDVNADMIVMGAYGHSRFREAILGGATRNMLEGAETPVFMAH